MKPLAVCLSVLLFTPLLTLSQSHDARDTNFIIALSHNDAEPGGIVAEITTTATYPCEGYRIQTRLTQNMDTLTVHIGGLIRPSPCFHTSGNAETKILLGNFHSEILLRISYRGESDMYKITIDNNTFIILPMKKEFTEVRGTR